MWVRKHHFTELPSLHLVDNIDHKMNANEIPVNVYIHVHVDLSKLFKNLEHNNLLLK